MKKSNIHRELYTTLQLISLATPRPSHMKALNENLNVSSCMKQREGWERKNRSVCVIDHSSNNFSVGW